MTANLHLDYIQRPAQHTLEITASKGRITWDNADGSAKRYDVDNKTWEEYFLPEGFERNHLFMAEMAHFLRVVKHEESPTCTLDDGLKALEISLAVYDSAQKGCLVKFNR